MDQAQGLRRLIDKRAADRRPLRIVATASGKGGVGKTMVSSNLAVLAARDGKQTLVVDADLGLANVEIALGIKPEYHLGHLLEGSVDVTSVLAEGPHGIRVLSAGSGVQHLTHLDDAQKLRLVSALDLLEDAFDFVVVDVSAGIGDNVLFFAGGAQETVLVVNAEPTALSDAYAAVKVLSQQAGVKYFDVVVNPVATEQAAREVYDRLARVTDRFLDASIRYLGYIPYDETVRQAVMARVPVVDAFPHGKASRALVDVSLRLSSWGAPADTDGGLKFMWQRLFRDATDAVEAQP